MLFSESSRSRHSLVLSQFGPGHHMQLSIPILCRESGPAHGWNNITALEPPEVRSPRPLPSTLLREDSGFCSDTISRPQWTFQPSWLLLHRHYGPMAMYGRAGQLKPRDSRSTGCRFSSLSSKSPPERDDWTPRWEMSWRYLRYHRYLSNT